MHVEPQEEHRWLHQLIGNWTMEGEFNMGPDQPPMKSSGKESVRSFGDLWIIADGEGVCDSIITLGYDPLQQAYVGTFVGSTMTHLWIYKGSLNAEKSILTLDSEGPSFTGTGMAKYQDIIEIVSPDHRILRSQLLTESGVWQHFMTSHYRREK